MLQFPNANLSHSSAVKYMIVRDLIKTNQGDTITINYRHLDPETKGSLKSTLDHRFKYWIDKKSYISNDVYEYLVSLFKLNQGEVITIEYEKLVCNKEDDLVFEIRHKTYNEKVTITQDIRYYINKVLVERKSKLYNNMILNPTV